MREKLSRTSKNISVAIRFLGEKIDKLEELLKKFDKNCNMEDEVIELDRLTSDFNELYELLYNLSEELNEISEENLKENNEN